MISSCRCDPQLDPEMMAARAHACLLTARDDAVLCSTPCFSCSAVLLFVPISASRLSARECESKSVARSPARSRNARTSCSARAFLWFLLKAFFFPPLGSRRRLSAQWAKEARLLHWVRPQRPANAGAGAVPPRRGTLLCRRRKFFELVAGEADCWSDGRIWAEKWLSCYSLLLRDLVERSILVYGKWGRNGRLRGAMGGMSFACIP